MGRIRIEGKDNAVVPWPSDTQVARHARIDSAPAHVAPRSGAYTARRAAGVIPSSLAFFLNAGP